MSSVEDQKKYFSLVSRQANMFVESPFLQEYTEQELKTLEYIISQLTKDDIKLAENNQVKIIKKPIIEFAKLIGAHPNDLYKRANVLSESLMNKKIRFKILDDNKNVGFEKHSFFTSMAYKNGQLVIGINPFVLPYFIDISSQYTEFRLANILRIGSSYGIKLYKLLKQYENTTQKYRDFEIEDLRVQFGIGIEKNEKNVYVKYNRYNNFKQFVIDTAIEHINKHTDIQVSYIEKKEGRKIAKLRFHIRSKLTQLEQAKIAFSEFMNSLPDGKTLKERWKNTKPSERIKEFSKGLTVWIEQSCHNYIAVSTDILEFDTENSLLYDQTEVAKAVHTAIFQPLLQKKS